MKVSAKGLEFTQDMEGTKYYGYLDPVGIPTAGVGHTGSDVVVGKQYTQEQVFKWLADDMAYAENEVNKLVRVELTQNQFDMLCDFVFNVGAGAFATSTLLKKLNGGDYEGAANEFKRWVYAKGKILPGLVKRRYAQAERFRSA
jgi:lysozyme